MNVTLLSRKFIWLFLTTLILVSCGGSDNSTPEPTAPTPDTTAPVITLNGESALSISFGSAYEEAGATATDNVDGSVNVVVSGSVNTSVVGEYTITYTATDAAGNSASATRNVNVIDDIPPVITLNGESSISLFVNQEYVELGATASDNVDGNVNVVITSSVDTSVVGEYAITYTTTDFAGNQSSKQRRVIVNIQRPFVTTWDTTKLAGTSSNQIKLLTKGDGYNYTVDWGDGVVETGLTGQVTHTYATSGVYTVAITGEYPRFYMEQSNEDNVYRFHNSDNEKLLTIEQWGDIEWRSMESAFIDAQNLEVNATDNPNLSQVTNMSDMFRGIKNINQDINSWDVSNVTNMSNMFAGGTNLNSDISNWDVSNVTDMSFMFRSSKNFNQDISAWDVSNVRNMNYMLEGATSFNQDIGGWDVSNVTNMGNMFLNASLSVDNYDALLLGWSTQQLQSNVSFSGGNSKYSSTSEAARQSLIDVFNWSVTDGGIQ